MALMILMGSLALLLVFGVPVAFALFAASVLTFFFLDIAPVIAVQQMASGISVFSLMAIPFFIFAGDLMYRSGIAKMLVNLADAALGRTRGGLGQVDVGVSVRERRLEELVAGELAAAFSVFIGVYAVSTAAATKRERETVTIRVFIQTLYSHITSKCKRLIKPGNVCSFHRRDVD